MCFVCEFYIAKYKCIIFQINLKKIFVVEFRIIMYYIREVNQKYNMIVTQGLEYFRYYMYSNHN